MFQNGLGVQTDYAKAMHWFVEAAAHGNSDAENQLGWMYQHGQGVEPDDAKAVTWDRMDADQRNRHACCTRSHHYSRSLGLMVCDAEPSRKHGADSFVAVGDLRL